MKPFPVTPWIAYHRPSPDARVRLFCFAYAGGGASIFVPWIEALAPACEVCPIQLPGREARFSEPLLKDTRVAAELAARAMAPACEEPYALFGHSLGAILAYEVAQHLRKAGVRDPEHLFVSARRGALVPHNGSRSGHLPDEQFKARLMELNGTPREFLDNPDLVELLLPRVRQDFLLDETYQPKPDYEPLDCPISAFGGTEDRDVPEASLQAWSAQTNREFSLSLLTGADHFFIQSRREDLIDGVRRALVTQSSMASAD